MMIIYRFLTTLLIGLLRIAALLIPKIKTLFSVRKNWFQQLQQIRNSTTEEFCWFHVASLGEYEQAKPVIQKLKNELNYHILISFFSPSGYEHAKLGENEHKIYLPLDTVQNAREFISTLTPTLAIFVKYDIWPNFITESKKNEIPLYLISAALRTDQIYFKWYGSIFKKSLKSFDHIFTQNEASITLLQQLDIKNCTFVGDTRFDRVIEISQNPKSFPDIEDFLDGAKCIVIGSCWEEDMTLLIPFINSHPDLKYIIAPHDIRSKSIDIWMEAITLECIKYSEINQYKNARVLIIDNIGMLSSLYQYAYISYVGGAFGKGLHNILEPLAFLKPTLFGEVSKINKFPEATISAKYGCSYSVSNSDELTQVINDLLNNSDRYSDSVKAAIKYVNDNKGSSSKIIKHIQNHQK
ncbi:3-deoxy-D-manno-octulosonic acid transferase [Penaeicola halotolerans]|uniref:3-deoxy-D-manno-octulosonic acid transferase n=1 Tax=Penaeicola halotolerans TaxID=2793196 RepID=UPI001CF8734D|nr:glycosyltransferase N-terminal domain-containing protein [Penaeicola halotolerans]